MTQASEGVEIGDFFIEYPDFDRPVGKGAFGSVYYCSRKGETAKDYVAKRLTIKGASPIVLSSERDANEMLQDHPHPNIVKIEAVIEDSEFLSIIMKYYNSGTLEDYVKARSFLKFSEVMKFCKEIAGGLTFLHQCQYMHRDMKLANVYLHKEDNGEIKSVIGDFGFSAGDTGNRNTIIGTPLTMAPELSETTGDTYTYKVDIWALGVILYQMCFGQYPFDMNTPASSWRNKPYIIPQCFLVSLDCLEFIESCLQYDPNKRPTTEWMLSDKVFYHMPLKEQTMMWTLRPLSFNTGGRNANQYRAKGKLDDIRELLSSA